MCLPRSWFKIGSYCSCLVKRYDYAFYHDTLNTKLINILNLENFIVLTNYFKTAVNKVTLIL